MTLADELAEIAAKVAVCRAQLDLLSSRIVNSTNDATRHQLRMEQGGLMGECLSYRLKMLYKIEAHWPEVLQALRASTCISGSDS